MPFGAWHQDSTSLELLVMSSSKATTPGYYMNSELHPASHNSTICSSASSQPAEPFALIPSATPYFRYWFYKVQSAHDSPHDNIRTALAATSNHSQFMDFLMLDHEWAKPWCYDTGHCPSLAIPWPADPSSGSSAEVTDSSFCSSPIERCR